MTKPNLSLIAAALAFAATAAGAQQYVYPAKGQSKEQQAKDEASCTDWAKGQVSEQPPQGQPAPPPPKGGRVRGAVAGAVIGASRQRREGRAQQAEAQQQAQAAAGDAMGKARAACLEGKGYTVK